MRIMRTLLYLRICTRPRSPHVNYWGIENLRMMRMGAQLLSKFGRIPLPYGYSAGPLMGSYPQSPHFGRQLKKPMFPAPLQNRRSHFDWSRVRALDLHVCAGRAACKLAERRGLAGGGVRSGARR